METKGSDKLNLDTLEDMTRHYKLITPPKNTTFILDRKEEVIFTRIRIGHILFTHKLLFTNIALEKCPQCDTNITIKHIIGSCVLYKTKKEDILGPNFKDDDVKNITS